METTHWIEWDCIRQGWIGFMGEWSLVRRKGHWIGLWSRVTQLQTSTSEHGSMYLKCNHTTTYYFYYIEPCSEVESHYYILLLLHTTTYYIEPCSGAESHSSKHGHLQHTRAHVTDCNKWAQGYLLAFEIEAFLRFLDFLYAFIGSSKLVNVWIGWTNTTENISMNLPPALDLFHLFAKPKFWVL